MLFRSGRRHHMFGVKFAEKGKLGLSGLSLVFYGTECLSAAVLLARGSVNVRSNERKESCL